MFLFLGVCPTGASPGHSYTVKSPPTSSSSDVTSVSTVFCSGLWLQKKRENDVVTFLQTTHTAGKGENKGVSEKLTFPLRASAAFDAGSDTSEHSGPEWYLPSEEARSKCETETCGLCRRRSEIFIQRKLWHLHLRKRWAAAIQRFRWLWRQEGATLWRQGSPLSEPGVILSLTCRGHHGFH